MDAGTLIHTYVIVIENIKDAYIIMKYFAKFVNNPLAQRVQFFGLFKILTCI